MGTNDLSSGASVAGTSHADFDLYVHSISGDGTMADGQRELDGLKVTRRLHQDLPKTPVIVLTMHDDSGRLKAVSDAGAAGYLVKSSAARELLAAISEVLTGRRNQTSGAVGNVMSSFLDPKPKPAKSSLSPREMEISALVTQGLETAEIADRLCIAEVTVRTHYHRILRKLDLRNRVELTHYALSRGWTSLNDEPS